MDEQQNTPEEHQSKIPQRNFVAWIIIGAVLLVGCAFGAVMLLRGIDNFGNRVIDEEKPEPSQQTKKSTEDNNGQITEDPNKVYYLGDAKNGYVKVVGNNWKKLDREWSKGVQYYSGLYVMLIAALDSHTGSAKDYAQSLYDIAVPTLNVDDVSLEETSLGKYEKVYKLTMKDDHTSSWNVEWIFEAEDEKIHYILIQGTDLESDKFNIPETFTLTLPEE